MDQGARLFAQNLGHAGVAMPQRADGDSRDRVKVFVAVFIPQPASLPAHEAHREPGVGGKKGGIVVSHERLMGFKAKRQPEAAALPLTGGGARY